MRRSTLGFALLLSVGCFHDSTGPVPNNVHGRYVLRSLNGLPLPQVYADLPALKLEFLKGTVLLRPDSTFSDSTELRRTQNNVATRVIDVAEGRFVVVADTVKLSSTRGEHYFMTYTQTTLTQDLGGRILLYRR